MKDYIFLKRKHQVSAGWLVLGVILCLLIVGYTEKKENVLRKELEAIREDYRALQGKSVHNWIMDESCSDQLLNSTDGVLRIKVTR